MFSFLKKVLQKQKRQKRRKNKKNKFQAPSPQVMAPAVLTTALLIPVVIGLVDNVTAPSGAGDVSALVGGSGSTSGGGDLGSYSAGGGTSGSGLQSDVNEGMPGADAGSGGGAGGGGGSAGAESNGSLDGLVLAYQEAPLDGSVGDSAGGGSSGGNLSGAGQTVEGSPGLSGTASAFDANLDTPILCIEEDWELCVSGPDVQLAGPQLWTVMSPFESAENFHLAFTMNHRVEPSFSPGGMELQLWYQGKLLGWNSAYDAVLATSNETVRWTQRLEIKGGKLWFSIVNGQSATWGEFGKGESFHLCIDTTLPWLNAYHPNVSTTNSGILFASNRVKSLVLREVRAYGADASMVLSDKEPAVVFQGD